MDVSSARRCVIIPTETRTIFLSIIYTAISIMVLTATNCSRQPTPCTPFGEVMTPKRHAEMDAPANPATGAAAQSTTFSSSSQQPLQRAGGLSQQRWESITRGLAARSRVPITSELPAPVAEKAVDRTAHDPIPESRLDRPSGMASL